MTESSYGSYLLYHFAGLRCEGTLCDVKLIAGDGTEFLAHRLILGAVSPFFAGIFAQANPSNGSHTVVHLKNTDGPSVATVVDFLYTGFIDFHRGPDLKVVRNIASRCQIAPLNALLSVAAPACDTTGDKVLKSLRAGFSNLSTALTCSPCHHASAATAQRVSGEPGGKSSRGVCAELTDVPPPTSRSLPVPNLLQSARLATGGNNFFRNECADEPTPSFSRPICVVPPATSTPKDDDVMSPSYFSETTLKPFSCKFCLRTYSTSRKLMLHCDRVHAYNPFLKFTRSPFNLNSFNAGGEELSEISRTSCSTVYSNSAFRRRVRRRRSLHGYTSSFARNSGSKKCIKYRSWRRDSTFLSDSTASRKRSARTSRRTPTTKRTKTCGNYVNREAHSSRQRQETVSVEKLSQSKSVGSQTEQFFHLSPLTSEQATSDQFKSDLIGSETFTDHIPSPRMPVDSHLHDKTKPLFAVPTARPLPRKERSGKSSRRVLNRVRSREPTPFELKIPSSRVVLTDLSFRNNSCRSRGAPSCSTASKERNLCHPQVQNEVTPKPPPLPPRSAGCFCAKPKSTTGYHASSTRTGSSSAATASSGTSTSESLSVPSSSSGRPERDGDERDYGPRARQRVVTVAPPAPPPSEDGSVATHSDLLASLSGTDYHTAPIDEATVVNYGTV